MRVTIYMKKKRRSGGKMREKKYRRNVLRTDERDNEVRSVTEEKKRKGGSEGRRITERMYWKVNY